MPETTAERLGPMIRRLRTAAGLSQEELAERVEQNATRGAGSLGRTEVSRWERERRLVGPYWVGPLAKALSVRTEDLQAARGVSRATRRAAPAAVVAEHDDVLASALLNSGFAPLETAAGRRVGQTEVDILLRRCHALRLADDVVAGGDLFHPVMHELTTAQELYRTTAHRESVGRALLSVIAELAQLAGWVATDAGGGADPAHLYRLGASAAVEAGDRPLVGQLLGSLAYTETNRGRLAVGLEIARTLESESGQEAPPRARSLALDRLAWSAVRAGDAQTALRAVGESAAALREHQPGDDDHYRWLYWVGDDERRVMEARVYTEAHRPLRAVPLLRRVLADYDTSHVRELALYLSWLTVALADANEPEEAAAVARQMLELAASVPSSRAHERRKVVLGALQPFASAPEVADLMADWASQSR